MDRWDSGFRQETEIHLAEQEVAMLQRGDTDKAVRETNDDAQVSKMACVRLGYFQDDFLPFFVRGTTKRVPLINRGYYARASALKQLVDLFIRAQGETDQQKQIVSLGAGYDTSWFHLKAAGCQCLKYIEIDFKEVTKRKIHIIKSSAVLQKLVQASEPALVIDEDAIIGSEYSLVPSDLRNLAEVDAALQRADLRVDLPTLILAECVLVYLPPEDSQAIITSLGRRLSDAAFVIYEQIKPYDAFGKQMMLNLQSRGCPLIGIHGTPDLEKQKQRFTEYGWQMAWARDMASVYAENISSEEKQRIEKLEIFDELEEWHLIQEHYCIAVGINDRSGILKNFTLPSHPQRPPNPFILPRTRAPAAQQAEQRPRNSSKFLRG